MPVRGYKAKLGFQEYQLVNTYNIDTWISFLSTNAEIFSVLADETPDISKQEQLAVSLRYVGGGWIIHEKFVRFVECHTGTSIASVAEKIRETIKDLGLDIKDLPMMGHQT